MASLSVGDSVYCSVSVGAGLDGVGVSMGRGFLFGPLPPPGLPPPLGFVKDGLPLLPKISVSAGLCVTG